MRTTGGEGASGRVWCAGVLAPPFSPEKGGEERRNQ